MPDPIPDDSLADLDDMQQQSNMLLEILRSASADLPPGPAREIADDLVAMLTDAAGEFFPAAHSMYDNLQQLRSARPSAARPKQDDRTTTPDELGPRLRREILQAYPGPSRPKEPEETSFTEGSLWKSFE